MAGWYNGCGPNRATYRLAGRRISVYARPEYPPGIVCIDLFGAPWAVTVDVGSLPSGLYTTELHVPSPPHDTTLCAQRSFSVLALSGNTLRGGITVNELLIDPNGSNHFDTDGNGTADGLDEFVEIYKMSILRKLNKRNPAKPLPDLVIKLLSLGRVKD